MIVCGSCSAGIAFFFFLSLLITFRIAYTCTNIMYNRQYNRQYNRHTESNSRNSCASAYQNCTELSIEWHSRASPNFDTQKHRLTVSARKLVSETCWVTLFNGILSTIEVCYHLSWLCVVTLARFNFLRPNQFLNIILPNASR